ncbi:MAG: ATP-dependent DNA helicase, partial [Planctomycetes bacterium]|nr:ATP-dependent DNA helicase [Planctomycetota bacterium]
VCTANIALQEQLIEKDLPLLAKTLSIEFSYALIKGIGNYLCLDRLEEVKSELHGVAFTEEEHAQWKKLTRWAGRTKSGDVSDLSFTPLDSLWNRVNGVTELCNGSECRFFDECFAMGARRRLKNVHVIVTNYHLFFAHLAVRMAAERDMILPTCSAVICDEAHDMADIARDFFGMRLSPFSVNLLVRGAKLLHLRHVGDRLRHEAREFFRRVSDYRRSGRYQTRLREANFSDASDLEAAVAEVREALTREKGAAVDEATADKIAKFDVAAARFLETLRSFLTLGDPNKVCWIEEDERATRLVSRVIDVSPILRQELFQKTPSVILTSATLALDKDFSFIKREIGADTAQEKVVPSPFDFRRQAILVVPRMEAEPNDEAFAGEMSAHINGIIRLLGGRTMALFTSYRNLGICAEAARETGVEILKQGDAPRSKLLEVFREDRGTALFATSSFWQGVDVPGKALSCLIIDKIPFLWPEDPLLAALQERDRQSFWNFSLPKATMTLRQGFGRLIRTQTDRGAVVIFDNRLFTARYGPQILAALPDVEVHRDLKALKGFFADEARATP